MFAYIAPVRPFARFVDEEPDDEFWLILHVLADTAYPAMFDAVNAVLRSVGTGVNRAHLASWIATNNRAAAIDALSNAWEQLGDFGLRERLLPQMHALALQAAEATTVATVAVAFNVRDPEALAAIALSAGQQITAISQTTREAIRGIVQRAFESGTTLTQQVSEIEALLGLTPRQTQQLSTFRQGLVEEGLKASEVQRAVERKARQMRRDRAANIARTESMQAVHMGQAERWNQPVREGLLEPARLRRYWIVTPDDRLCRTICAPIPELNPDGRGLDEVFDTPLGGILMPPAHPLCRCALSARVI